MRGVTGVAADPDTDAADPRPNLFERRLAEHGGPVLHAMDLRTLVVNVTLRCNQTCAHCHLECSPERTEMMRPDVMAHVVAAADTLRPELVDLTGGAPELNPDLPDLVAELTRSGRRVQLRTNLTALDGTAGDGLARSFSAMGVELVASMPCYTERNVRAVRGAGVRDASVERLRRLNALGYGVPGGLRLDLVYNPVGATLPEPGSALEPHFRTVLAERFGVSFTRLLTMTNMPVGRFRERLIADGAHDRYLRALESAFNPGTLPHLMCRHQVEVGWDGTLYDCDFHLAAGLPVSGTVPSGIDRLDPDATAGRPIVHADHCLGCSAGGGSS